MSEIYRLHYAPDNASLVIRLALDHMELPYETVLVDRRTKGHKHPAYLRLNPAGLIPVLETPEGPIFETAAILLWLADRHGAMAPGAENPDRGAFLKHLFFTSNTLHVAARMRFYPHQYVGNDPEAQTRLRRHMQGEVIRHLTMLDQAAQARPSWLGGAELSVLDVYVACLCRWMILYPESEDTSWCALTHWPHLHDMVMRLESCACTQVAIHAEGLGDHPFTNSMPPSPPEGSVL